MSQLPVPYVPETLVVRATRAWPFPAPLADWSVLLAIALAAATTAAVIAVIAVHTWR